MNKSKFSIITASYNNAPYLEYWSESIIKQNYRPIEVIFVNDCSEDNTEECILNISSKFAKNNIEFKYIKNSNRSFYSDSLSIATSAATGDFVGILDSDDALVENCINKVVDLYNKYKDIGYIYTQFENWNSNFSKKIKTGFSRAPLKNKSLLDMGVRNIHTFSHWKTFAPNRIKNILDIWKPGLKCSVDKYMGYILEEKVKGAFYNKVCYKYRYGLPGSISKTEKSMQMWKNIVKELSKRRKKLKIKPFPILEIK